MFLQSRSHQGAVNSTSLRSNTWASRVLALPQELRALRTGGATEDSEALVLLWRTLAEPKDATISEAYRGFSEADILKHIETLQLDAPDWGFAPAATDDFDALVFKVAGHVRALECLIMETDTGARPANPEVAWAVKAGGEAAFVVPIPRFSWVAPPAPEEDFRVFDRRGLTRVRIIPRMVGDASVRLIQPAAAQPLSERLGFGAALVPGLQVEFSEFDGLVTAISARAPSMEQVLRHSVAGAHSEKCFALVYPELSIDSNSLQAIKDVLLAQEWDDSASGRHNISVVVAGSWHQSTKAGIVNEAAVLSGSGRFLLGQQKRLPWRSGRKRENILRGEELWILVLGDMLIGFGICLDFCQRLKETPYRELDVDLVLVPSLGNDLTMSGHAVVAQGLHINRGAKCFVVQAADPPLEGFDGYVLPPENPQSTAAETFRQSGFSTHFSTFHSSHARS